MVQLFSHTNISRYVRHMTVSHAYNCVLSIERFLVKWDT